MALPDGNMVDINLILEVDGRLPDEVRLAVAEAGRVAHNALTATINAILREHGFETRDRGQVMTAGLVGDAPRRRKRAGREN